MTAVAVAKTTSVARPMPPTLLGEGTARAVTALEEMSHHPEKFDPAENTESSARTLPVVFLPKIARETATFYAHDR
jgi:hypothetical protein